jgi:long-subunit acyl-CoA synthetase (AMP-forming)
MSDLPQTYPHILLDNAKKFPPKKAAIREKDYGIWQAYSWQDYLDQVRDFALGLFPPKKAAIREKDYGIWQAFSWQDYLDQARDFALGLAALGFKKEDKMAIIGDNRPQLYWGVSACQCLGGVPVPFPFTRMPYTKSFTISWIIRSARLPWQKIRNRPIS